MCVSTELLIHEQVCYWMYGPAVLRGLQYTGAFQAHICVKFVYCVVVGVAHPQHGNTSV